MCLNQFSLTISASSSSSSHLSSLQGHYRIVSFRSCNSFGDERTELISAQAYVAFLLGRKLCTVVISAFCLCISLANVLCSISCRIDVPLRHTFWVRNVNLMPASAQVDWISLESTRESANRNEYWRYITISILNIIDQMSSRFLLCSLYRITPKQAHTGLELG